MDNYIVSARKYRPITFDSVVGQRSLTTTLKNAISTGKLAHAYLFCGPRGVGKTTCARIFAKTINCLTPTAQGEACDGCESCVSFNEQRSYNIHELDAASNNSVDDIRSLIDQVRIPPQVGRYKVYIIDEVHMLSQAAFNAFLKTLEEPPHHAIFILATTEKHKILPTILSRCQTYDFNRIGVSDTVDHLQYVAQKEGIEAEPEALGVIAQKADGGMRDALSIFDQVVSYTGGKVTYKQTIENLNVLDYEYYFTITKSLLERKVSEALLLFNEILNKGLDGNHFITGLASHFRDLLVSRDAATLPLLEVADTVRTRYLQQSQLCEPKFLYRAMKICNDCDLNYRVSKNKRFCVELALIQVAQINDEDGDSSGLGPKKQLKPLFTQQAASAVQVTQPQAQAPVAQSGGATQVTPRTATAKNANVGNVVHEMPQAETRNTPKPVVPTSRISLKRGVVNTANPQVSAVKSEQHEKQNQAYNMQDVRHCWFEFANFLPADDKSTAMRMKVMPLSLLEGNIIEVVVGNEMLKTMMEGYAPKIEQHLRKGLRNDWVKLNFKVADAQQQKHAYSKNDQYKQMATKNPSLHKLKEAFGLEFG